MHRQLRFYIVVIICSVAVVDKCVLLNSRHQVMHLQLILPSKSTYHHWHCWRFVAWNI